MNDIYLYININMLKEFSDANDSMANEANDSSGWSRWWRHNRVQGAEHDV